MGVLVGIGLMLIIMGKPIRDIFFGRDIENRPIVIDWLDGHTKDFQVMMRGVLVFTGIINSMTLNNSDLGHTLQMDIVSKARVQEAMRVFDY